MFIVGGSQKSRDYDRRLDHLIALLSTFRSPEDAADLAHTGQLIYEELLCEFLQSVHDRFGGENLIFGGGYALNSSGNGKILSQTPYARLHVPMAPGDDGNAIGAAILAWKLDHPRETPRVTGDPYLGSAIEEESLERLKTYGGLRHEAFLSEQDLAQATAREPAEGKFSGWVQGRAEFGPRALGNRSILADPRDPEVRHRLNAQVKFREEFRPLAPSVLHRRGAEYFSGYQFSPYMERTLPFARPEAAPGVVHQDETGRVQSVTQELNPVFSGLLTEFERLTGLPMLLNTGYNLVGRPIMHDMHDAVAVFLTTGLDVLVIGKDLFRKS